jgi:hypothetical protein
MTAPDYHAMKTGDLSPSISYDMTELEDAVETVTFSMRKLGELDPKIDEAAATFTAVTSTSGRATYDWGSQDVDEEGTFWGEFNVTYENGDTTTYPNNDYVIIVFKASL